jgi:hypothetical protein
MGSPLPAAGTWRLGDLAVNRQLGRDHLDLVNLRTLSVSKPVGEHFAALGSLALPARLLGRARPECRWVVVTFD